MQVLCYFDLIRIFGLDLLNQCHLIMSQVVVVYKFVSAVYFQMITAVQAAVHTGCLDSVLHHRTDHIHQLVQVYVRSEQN